MKYLNAGARQLSKPPFKNRLEVFEHLSKVVERVQPELILEDIGRFLEDPAEQAWLKSYQTVLNQLVAAYLKV